MSNRLAGVTFCYRGISQDYNFIETVYSLLEVCDMVYICAGGEDGTYEKVYGEFVNNDRVKIGFISEADWKFVQGREKLAYFQNQSLPMLRAYGFDWYLLLQSDEIIHPSSYSAIKRAIATDEEGFYVTRVNLWGSCYHRLNVPENRSPVGTHIIRLARTFYPSIGDGESILADARDHFVNDIKIIHYGFVRSRAKHIVKIKHIQDEVFLIPHDTRVDGVDKFNPWNAGFTPADVVPIDFEHPPVIQKWVDERNPEFEKF